MITGISLVVTIHVCALWYVCSRACVCVRLPRKGRERGGLSVLSGEKMARKCIQHLVKFPTC